ADLAVGLEPADAGAVTGPRIDNDEPSPRDVDFDAGGRHDPHATTIDGPFKQTTVNHKLSLEVEHVRSGFSHMRAILVAPLAHHIPEQDGSLRGVDRVLGCGRKPIKDRSDSILR